MTAALRLTMTTAGLGRFTAAQAADDIDLTIASVGLTAAPFAVSPTLTALPGEFRRVTTIAGDAVGDSIVHMIVRDDEPLAYEVRGFGLFLADGTLFAVYGQVAPIVGKSSASSLLLALDIAFPTTDITQLTFGDTNFLNPPATEERAGVVEFATDEEADEGTDRRRVLSVAGISRLFESVYSTISAVATALNDTCASVAFQAAQYTDVLAAWTVEGSGLVTGGGRNDTDRTLTVTPASAAQVRAGVADDRAVTPSGLAEAGAVYVIEQSLTANGGHRVWSDGLKECWGLVAVPANSTVAVALPVAHETFVVPAGAGGAIAQDQQMLGVLNVALSGFDVRSRNPIATTYYWHTKGV
jgi:hypothetical protein